MNISFAISHVNKGHPSRRTLRVNKNYVAARIWKNGSHGFINSEDLCCAAYQQIPPWMVGGKKTRRRKKDHWILSVSHFSEDDGLWFKDVK